MKESKNKRRDSFVFVEFSPNVSIGGPELEVKVFRAC